MIGRLRSNQRLFAFPRLDPTLHLLLLSSEKDFSFPRLVSSPKLLLHSPQAPPPSMLASPPTYTPGSSPIDVSSPPHVIPHPLCQIDHSRLLKKCPISHSTLSNRPEKVEFFFPFMISLIYSSESCVSKNSNLNSWSPNRL
ncbi:hypothetical protein MTR67_030689 [Solanum verrucosum]|uniref:Uncharacterized protein n=1 Tax=Solanum verrucosum TaxID=315347 RepID=A0AAF0R6G9_SOLVR|nr:hypothetical protein MTR67_030689 [Solanum verrucosum]